jgi:hypothetical protein
MKSTPGQFHRPTGTFVFVGNPSVRPVVTTTPAPETTTAAPTKPQSNGSASYNYQYDVNDPQSGVNLGQNENQDGMFSFYFFNSINI